ncbi:LAGLIDADG family homing endonuclease [Rhodothermus profundi]|uniref:Vitamin B12-dependent ribonucleotide reductase n=1 Tax=Rhodothermus profundi TaxID=633813 RepID=A0A1M6TLU6_9BACT|nr:LAGLIDADG family homing endonuclease [Rhodothermus profundi]SHK57890.1 ribonucleoside-diphosphate reductase alpha chain [Rhodothermus profundi]
MAKSPRKSSANAQELRRGLRIARVFSQEGVHPFDTVRWERRTAAIYNSKGEAVFEQKEVEFPTTWSQLATNVVASKYFYGDLAAGNGDPREGKREYSLKQLIHRVTRTIADWGKAQGYFATPEDAERFYDELTWLCLHQYGAFNSPVWFNVGLYHQYGVRDTGGKTIFGWDFEKQRVVPVDPYERPQASACFIISVEDSIDDIWQLMAESARLFKFGSGVGADWSRLRSTKEKLSGGGRPSGPVSFMRVQDATGATIKSGGKTRRAAIMQTLKVWHPDIMEFVTAKAKEEKKAWALIEQGYDGSFNGEAYSSVAFQNVNQSVRVTDEFMEAVLARKKYPLRAVTTGEVIEEIDAYELLYKVAEGTWICGDPGLQYEDTIQKWHTCKRSGPINSSNPCVTGDTLVATEDGLRRIDSLVGETPRVVGLDGRLHRTTRVIETGIKPVYRLRTRCGYEVKLTADHRVWTENRGDVPAAELTRDDVVRLVPPRFGRKHLDPEVAEYIGLMVGDGCLSHEVAILTLDRRERAVAEKMAQVVNQFDRQTHRKGVQVAERPASVAVATGARTVQEVLKQFAVLDQGAAAKRFTEEVFQLDRQSVAALLRGLFTADGTVANYGSKSQYISLDSSSQELLKQVQLLLLGFGIKSKLYENRRLTDRALLPDGKGGVQEYRVQPMYSLRISRSSRVRFEREIGFLPESPKAAALRALNATVSAYEDPLVDQVVSLELLGEEPVYDLTEPVTDHFVANGIAVHNCSEYMFLDNSACNLASLNLRKFQRADGSFDVERFRAAVRIFITAMEILVDNAGYPSEKIAQNSHDYRPLGLGFANLGALLMAMGLPYDSDEGRAVAGAITAIMHAEAYARSAEIAAIEGIGPFPGFEKNRESMLEVMRLHQAAVEDIHPSCPAYLKEAARESMARMVALGERYGYRNAQATVLAPTGTISFLMDCDTTGIEPDIALVKYKLLAGKGDGMFKIVNNTVPIALRRLGYSEAQIKDILAYIEENDTIEGAPHLKEEHLPVFDCAFKPYKGQRFIHYMGHIKMMAACQPFISGAISKTVNMPEHVTVEEIMDAYIQGWKLGLKALAIYRENSKRSQPLSTRKEDKKAEAAGDGVAAGEPQVVEKIVEKVVYKPVRKRLPDERPSITHKFSVAGHEGYLHIGLYPDTGMPGEIFITMAKQGSTISGLMDAFATAISIALQYGVPLEDLCNKFSHMRFEPAGFTNNPQIPIAKSIMDYIFRYLSLKFLGRPQEEKSEDPQEGVAAEVKRSGPARDERQLELSFETQPTGSVTPLVGQTIETFLQTQQRSAVAAAAEAATVASAAFQNQEDAPACSNCGSITVRSGACYVCPNCGSSSGCG